MHQTSLAPPSPNESPSHCAVQPSAETQGLSPGPRPGFPLGHGVAAQHPIHEALTHRARFSGEEAEGLTCNPKAQFRPGRATPRPQDPPWGPPSSLPAPLDLRTFSGA